MVLSGGLGGAFVGLGPISSPAGGRGATLHPSSSALPYFHV